MVTMVYLIHIAEREKLTLTQLSSLKVIGMLRTYTYNNYSLVPRPHPAFFNGQVYSREKRFYLEKAGYVHVTRIYTYT